jgi:hypothetical protein
VNVCGRLVGVVLVCCLTTPIAVSAQPLLGLAPADEYFGPTKMSPLEITNRIRDAERRGATYRGLLATQAAIEDWTRKYPRDPWIAPREYRISRLFAHLRSHVGATEAAHCQSFLRTHFRTTHKYH